MNFQTIRFKYSAAFTAVALIMAISGFISFNLINTQKDALEEFSKVFNPAISAVINADRDLYQARVAELETLIEPKTIDAHRKDYDDNAQQAYDRMQTYMDLLSGYPDIIKQLDGFDAAFNKWKSASTLVFTNVRNDKLDAAKQQSIGASQDTFGALRDFYDIAGEAADQKGLALGVAINSMVTSRSTLIAILLLITVAFALGLGLYAPRTMSVALNNLSESLRELNSGDGDLSRRINSTRKDEIGDVARGFDEFLDGLSTLIKTIAEQSKTVMDDVAAMDKGASGVAKTSRQQMESVDMIVTAVNEMTVAIKEVAQNAQSAASDIAEVNRLCDEGKDITVEAVKQIKKVSATVSSASHAMGELAESSNNIASVLDVIRGIAEQTNLLALNAAIEAARAGEQGRGFAVVADEVRSLASKTQQSTDDIQKMIEALQKGVKEAVGAIEQGLESVNASVEKTESTTQALDSIVHAADRVSDASVQIATSTEEQSQVAEEVNTNLVTLADLGKSSYEHSTENKDRAVTAAKVTKQLNDSVTRFKLS